MLPVSTSVRSTHRGNRAHIAIAGRCNTGKSTILNHIVGQSVAIVSEKAGTTADPVAVPFELLPFGAVTFHDTAGLDEQGELGELRRKKSYKIIDRADLVILVTDEHGLGKPDKDLIDYVKNLNTPILVVANKTDIKPMDKEDRRYLDNLGIGVYVAGGSPSLQDKIVSLMPVPEEKFLLADLLPKNSVVVCVIPIDSAAPKGRLIAPQVQLLRELMDHNMVGIITQPSTLAKTLEWGAGINLVVADSQAILEVANIVPNAIPLVTFSLLFARLKGDFRLQLDGARAIDRLKPGARVLIAEACSHHAQEDDIARVKIPKLLEKRVGGVLSFTHVSGGDFPDELGTYDLVLHCGGCMLSPKAMHRRLSLCKMAGVPVTNYGMAISFCQGVLERVATPLL